MKTCVSCKHSSTFRLFGWITGSPIDMKCRHPIVHQEIWKATSQGYILPSYMYGGPLFRADPVTGRPAYAEISCFLARGEPFKITGREPQDVTFLCLPEGRYWEPRK